MVACRAWNRCHMDSNVYALQVHASPPIVPSLRRSVSRAHEVHRRKENKTLFGAREP